MRMKHIVKRGAGYQFMCRVPRDLQQHFPSPTLYRSLKATDDKSARVIAAGIEYQTQQLFLQLRSAMLPKELEKHLVNLYLRSFAAGIESTIKDQGFAGTEPDATGVSALFDNFAGGATYWSNRSQERPELRALKQDVFAELCKRSLKDKSPDFAGLTVDLVAEKLQKSMGIKMSANNRKALAMELTNADRQLATAEGAALRGDWSPLEQLKEKVSTELKRGYHDFKSVLEKYRAYYLAKNPDVTQNTKDDMEVECRVLLEIIGNTSIETVNTMDTISKLKAVLKKYPLCKQQRYGDLSVHSIIKTEKDYKTISRKTANAYLKRLKAVIGYANKAKMLNAANVAEGELFRTETAAEEQRSAYDNSDIERLVNAICSQPLWKNGEPKPERFWLILIALFHGFRLGNIVKLTKSDICQTDKGTWVFRLRQGKTKATVRPVAICDALLLLGFLEWVAELKGDKLFKDSSDSFSKWYNRDETRKDGYTVKGFESQHVTTDNRKCLYSLRHSYGGNVFDVTSDFKVTSDMLGHSTGQSVTARYTKATKTETLKQVSDLMNIDHIDLDLLEARAQELFFR